MLLFLSRLAFAEAVAEPSVYKELLSRDGVPSCQILKERHSLLQEQLKTLISNDAKPSYVPMRAASCLLELYPQDLSTYLSWVEKKETLGLARLTISKLETLPVDVSIPLTEKALTGENAVVLLPKVQKIAHPDIQSLVLEHTQLIEAVPKNTGDEQ